MARTGMNAVPTLRVEAISYLYAQSPSRQTEAKYGTNTRRLTDVLYTWLVSTVYE